MSLQEFKPLILRSNRFLGTALLERKLITVEQLETANEKLLENIQQNDLRRANILHILLFEMQILNEDLYLESVVERYGLGLVDLHSCSFRKLNEIKPDLTACWATWTLPFDLVDDFYLLATAFYPSQPAVKFWQDKYANANVLWYATSVRSLQSALERIEQLQGAAKQPGGKTAASAATRSPLPAATPAKDAPVVEPVAKGGPRLSLGRGAEPKNDMKNPLKR